MAYNSPFSNLNASYLASDPPQEGRRTAATNIPSPTGSNAETPVRGLAASLAVLSGATHSGGSNTSPRAHLVRRIVLLVHGMGRPPLLELRPVAQEVLLASAVSWLHDHKVLDD